VPEEEIDSKHSKVIKETMFASHYSQEIKDQLIHCRRVMPHHQDTSGFFITIVEKVKEFSDCEMSSAEQQAEEPLPLQIQNRKSFAFVRCSPEDPDFKYLKAYYGLTKDFDAH
jgi:hypothetical protein